MDHLVFRQIRILSEPVAVVVWKFEFKHIHVICSLQWMNQFVYVIDLYNIRQMGNKQAVSLF